MHILINMNYIGFYLCYLLQTAKLINVLSSVLTQLFHKVKEVQRNFQCAARTSPGQRKCKFSSAAFEHTQPPHDHTNLSEWKQ